MPDTTPMPNETAKILVQKRARRWRCSRPVAIQRKSSVAIKADSPMVKLGKMMWNVTVKANCSRASRTGSRAGLESIGHSPAGHPRIEPPPTYGADRAPPPDSGWHIKREGVAELRLAE